MSWYVTTGILTTVDSSSWKIPHPCQYMSCRHFESSIKLVSDNDFLLFNGTYINRHIVFVLRGPAVWFPIIVYTHTSETFAGFFFYRDLFFVSFFCLSFVPPPVLKLATMNISNDWHPKTLTTEQFHSVPMGKVQIHCHSFWKTTRHKIQQQRQQ